MKKVIIPLIVVFLLIFIIYQGFFKKTKPEFNLVEVKRGTVLQEVSETGQVKKGKELNLTFKNAGKIEKISVEVGENVKEGQELAKLEQTSLLIQLREGQANLDLANAQLAKLLAGSKPEEIKITETKVKDASVALDSAKENLQTYYQSTFSTLNDVHLKLSNVYNFVNIFVQKYVKVDDEGGRKLRETRDLIKSKLDQIKIYLDLVKSDPPEAQIDLILSETKNSLKKVAGALETISKISEENPYANQISIEDKNSLDSQREIINGVISNIINAQHSIASAKFAIESAENQLKIAKNELEKIKSAPQEADVDFYEAQVRAAKAKVELLKNQLEDTILRSPIDGQVTKINKKEGEIVQSITGEVMITLLPVNLFQIEVDIYEEDVVKIKIGNPVDISLVAFPDQIFKGKVVAIDPAEKLTEGVVYYKVTIDPGLTDEGGVSEGVKPGMTADVSIKTASKENVLVIPAEAIEEKNGKKIVQVLKNGKIEEREIEVGLQGSSDLVEVISGIGEAEKIILK